MSDKILEKDLREELAFWCFKWEYAYKYGREVFLFNWDNEQGWAKLRYYEQAEKIIASLR